MALLKRIWIAMKTLDVSDAGTDDSIVLTITEGDIVKLQHTFPDTVQEDQERGRANLYEINVEGKNIRSERLMRDAIRLSISGSDLWQPKYIILWGEEATTLAVIPLAIETTIRDGLSTDATEGRRSIPIRRIIFESRQTRLRQLAILLTTSDVGDAGSRHSAEIELSFANGVRIWKQEFGLRFPIGEALFVIPTVFGFVGEPQPNRNNLDSITLRMKGDDAWLPKSFFLFAFPSDITLFRPDRIMPMVCIPNWTGGFLSTDTSEGRTSIRLPIARLPVV